MAAKKKTEKNGTDKESTRTIRDDAERKPENSPKGYPAVTGQTPEQLIHELEVHQIELKMQAEELRVAQHALEESRDKFLEQYDFAPIALLTLNDKGVITDVNLTASTLLGVPRGRLVNERFRKFIARDDLGQMDQCFVTLISHGGNHNCNLTLTRADGSAFPARLEAVCFTSVSGVTTVRVSFSDISEIRRSEEALRQSEILLRSMIESPQQIIIFSLGRDYRYLTFNAIHQATMKAIWGIDICPGMSILDVIGYESDRKKAQQNFDRALAGEHFMLTEEYGDDALSRKTWENTYSPMYDDKHQVIGLTVYVIDVTERKKAEVALATSEERFRMLFEQGSDSIFVADPNTLVITDCNRKAELMTRYSREELLSMQICSLHPKDVREATLDNFRKFADGLISSAESVVITRDGRRVPVSITGGSIEVNGQALLLGSFRDITTQKTAEEELRLYRNELELQNEELRTIQHNLEESRGQYMDLYDMAPVGYLTISDKGLVRRANLTASAMLSVERGTMINKPFSRFITPDDQDSYYLRRKQLANTKQQQSFELRMLRQGDTPLYAQVIMGQTPTDEEGDNAACSIMVIDITGRKAAEKALADSENKYRHLFEHAGEAIVVAQDDRLRLVNPRMVEITGYSEEELLAMPFLSYIHPSDHDSMMRIYSRLLKGEHDDYFPHYPIQLVTRDGGITWVEIGAVAIEWEGRPATLNFLTDITGRKVAEEALVTANNNLEQQVKERTAELFAANLNLKAEIEHRKSIADTLKESVKNTAILNEVIITANQADKLQQLFQDTLDRALELLDFDGGGIYLVNQAERTATIHYTKNLPGDFVEKRRTIPIDAKPYDTLFIRNKPIITGHFEKLSPELAQAYHFLSLASIPLVSKNKVIGALNVASTKRYTISADETQILIAIGRELGTTVERMIAEEEVKNISTNLQTLFDSINEMVFVLDMQGRILKVNESVLKRLCFSPGELIGTDVLQLHVPDRRDEALLNVQGMIAGTIDSCPVPLQAKNNDIIEVETKVTHGWWDKQEVLIGVSRDITERKHAEEALIQLSDRLSLAVKAGGVGIWDYDVVNNTLTWDAQMFTLYGITREQFGGAYEAWQAGLYPDDRERGDAEIQMALRGEKEFDTEFRVLWPDGTIRTIRALAIVQRDTNGEPLRMIGTNWDITEQTNAEKALRENDLLLRLILSLSAQFINISSDKIYLEISLALGELGRFAGVDRSYVFLLSPDGMTMDNTHEWCAEGIVAEKDNLQGLPTSMFPWWMERIRLFETIHVPRVADLPPEAENEREILAAQGIQSVLIVPLISQNTLIGFLGFDSVSHEKTWPDNIITLVTITGKSISNAIERERAEEALRRSEEQLSLALEGSNVGLWDWHVQTGATIFNERWAGILGYTLAELSPVSIKTWESLCHPDDLARSGELLQSHFSGKTPTYECEARMKHKEGHWVWVLDRGKVVEWDEAGRPARMTGTHLDITERVHHEEAIAASLREKETLLKEIHHRVKNNMQVISSLLNLQAKKIRDKNTLEIFRESQNRVRSIALIHEKLYRSKSLSQVDFQDFLQQLAENLFLSYGVRKDLVSFTISADEIYLPIDKAIPLGLITNELLTNSLKYAFPGQCKGTISIDLQKDKENYRYTFSDDGVGFPDDVEFDPGSDGNDTAQTLGLQLVIALVGQLQGTVILNRVNGTVFMIRFVYEEKGDDQD